MKFLAICVGVISFCLLTAQYSTAAESVSPASMESEIKTLKAQVASLLERVSELEKKPVQTQGSARAVNVGEFELTGNFIGDEKAEWTLVEFLDLECPYCKRFHQTTMPEIERELISKGKLNLLVMDLPLNFHANARYASHAVRCAGEFDKEEVLRNALLFSPAKMTRETINQQATVAGLDKASFQECMDSGRHYFDIQRQVSLASKLNIRGTPSFVIGRVENQKFQGGKVFSGAMDYNKFKQIYDEATGEIN